MVPFYFPSLNINTHTNFQKKTATNGPRNHSLQLATTRGLQTLMVGNHSLQLATTRCHDEWCKGSRFLRGREVKGKGSKKGKLKRKEMEGRNNLTVVAYVNQINLNK